MKKFNKILSFGLAFLTLIQSMPVYLVNAITEDIPANSIEFIDRDQSHYFDSDSPATDVVYEGDTIVITSELMTPQTVEAENVKWTWKPIISDWYYNEWLSTGTDSHYVVGGVDYIYPFPDNYEEHFSYKDYDKYTIYGTNKKVYENVRIWQCQLTIRDADLIYDDYSFKAGWYTTIDEQVMDEKGWLNYTNSDGELFWWNPYEEKLYAEDKETYIKDNHNGLSKVLVQDTNDDGLLIYTDGVNNFYYDAESSILYDSQNNISSVNINSLSKVYSKYNDFEFASRHILGVEPELNTNFTIVKDLEDQTVKIGDSITLESDFVTTSTPNTVRWEYSKNNGTTWETVNFGNIENEICSNQEIKVNDDGYLIYKKNGEQYFVKNGSVYQYGFLKSNINIDSLTQIKIPRKDSHGYLVYKDSHENYYYYDEDSNKLYNQYYKKVAIWKIYALEQVMDPEMDGKYYLYRDNKTKYFVDVNGTIFTYQYTKISDSIIGYTPILTLKPEDVRLQNFSVYEDACGFKTKLTLENISSEMNDWLFRVYVGEIEDETADGVDMIHDTWNRTSNSKLTVLWNVTLDLKDGTFSNNEFRWSSAKIKSNTDELIKELTVEINNSSSRINYDRDTISELGITVSGNEHQYFIFSSNTGLTTDQWESFIRDSLWIEMDNKSQANARFTISINKLNGAYIGKEMEENVDYYYSNSIAENNSTTQSKIVITPNEPTNISGITWQYLDLDVRVPEDLKIKSAQIQFTSGIKTEKIKVTSSTNFSIIKKSDSNYIINSTKDVTQEEWEQFFRHNVSFELINGREISIRWVASTETLDGTEYYNQNNDHYYKIVHTPNYDWIQANNLANQSSYMGKKGYLANVADAEEDEFIKTLLPNASAGYWIGEGCDYNYINTYLAKSGKSGRFSSGNWTTQRASLTEKQIFDIAAYVKGDKTYVYNGVTYQTTNYDGKDLGSSYALWFILTGPEAGQMIYYQTQKTILGKTFPGQVSRFYTPERDQVYHRFVHYTSASWPMCYTGHNEVPYTIIEYGGSPEDQDIEELRSFGIGKSTVIPGKTEITISKIWDDMDDLYNVRPESITINLLQNGELFDVITINENNVLDNDSNKWQITVENLPKYDSNSNLYTYTIDGEIFENSIFYEEPKYDQKNYTITNSLPPDVYTNEDPQNSYTIKINKNLVDENGNTIKDEDFDKIALDKNSNYKFTFELKEFERSIVAENNTYKEEYGEYTYNDLNIIINANDYIVISGIKPGKYEISELDSQYFELLSVTLNSKTDGVQFISENGKYFVILSGLTGNDENVELTFNNKIDTTRPYDDNDSKENIFKI